MSREWDESPGEWGPNMLTMSSCVPYSRLLLETNVSSLWNTLRVTGRADWIHQAIPNGPYWIHWKFQPVVLVEESEIYDDLFFFL